MFLFMAFVLILGLVLWVRAVSNRLGEVEAYSSREVRRGDDLESQFVVLRRRVDRLEAGPVIEKPVDRVEMAPAPVTPPPIPWAPPPVPKQEPPPIPWVQAAAIELPAAAATPNLAENITRLAEETGGWEALIGGDILNKLGALILVIGVALLLSYSFAHMGPIGRSLTGAGIGGALLLGGIACERLERYRVFSRGLMAAGWASLYFTSFAMHALPAAKVIDDPVLGTGLMVVVAAAMVLHSLRYRVQSLTTLAYGCIFAALALSDLTKLVAIALVPLAISALFLARRFEWYGLAVFAAGATYATYLSRPSSDATLFAIESMLLMFWALFESFDLLRAAARKAPATADYLFFGLNALAGLGASAAIWYRMSPDSMWEFCTASAALYLVSTVIRLALGGDSFYPITLSISAILGGLAIFAHFDGLWMSLGMLAEAEVLFLAGLYLNIRFARALSFLGFMACAMNILTTGGSYTILGAVMDGWAPPLAIVTVVFYLNRFLEKNAVYFGYLASAFAAIVLGFELPWRFVGLAWLVMGSILFELGLREKLGDLRIQGYALGFLGTAGASLAYLDPLHIRTAWVYAAGAALSFATAIRATKSLQSLPETERRGIRFVSAIATAALSAGLATRLAPETYWGISVLGVSIVLIELALRGLPEELWFPAIGLNVAAILRLLFEHAKDVQKHPGIEVWVSYAVASILSYGLAVRLFREQADDRFAFRIASGAFGSVFALVSLWMVLPDAFVPVSFIALALAIVVVGLVLDSIDIIFHGQVLSVIASACLYTVMIQPGTERIANTAALALAQLALCDRLRKKEPGFAFLHAGAAALVVFLTLFLEVSGGVLTVSWGVEAIGLLAIGFAIRERALRLSGLGLLLLCIGKVFFYDLRNLETPYRILSFIGLGAILLVVSWSYTRFKEQLQRFL